MLADQLDIPIAAGEALQSRSAASAHLLSLLPNPTSVAVAELPLLEVEVPRTVFQRDLLVKPLTVEDGFVSVPTGPGLGIDIDEDVLRAHVRR